MARGTNSDTSDSANTSRNALSPISLTLPSLFSNLRSNDLKSSSDSIANHSSPANRGCSNTKRNSITSENEDFNDSFELYPHELDPASDTYASKVPSVFLNEGLPLLRVSHKLKKRVFFRVDPSSLSFTWKYAPNASTMLAASRLLPGSNSGGSTKKKTYQFTVDDIKSVTHRYDASNYRTELHVLQEFELRWLLLIYFDRKRQKLKTLHVIADTEHDFRRLISVIESARRLRDDLAKHFLIDLKDMDEAQRNALVGKPDGKGRQVREFLTFDDVLKYSRRLNINVNTTHLRRTFDEVLAETGTGCSRDTLDFSQFRIFVARLRRRSDILKVWESYCDGKCMTCADFVLFATECQYESGDDLTRVFRRFCSSDSDVWLPENLNNYLLSKYSSPVFPSPPESYFNRPLQEYFISSSHNTYLTGRQVAGDLSIEGYIRTLLRGCRCVEIDVWDGEGDEGPSVNHGRTFTHGISFQNVVTTIKKHAFIATPYPLIISLDINCSQENQLKVVKILHETLGDTMVTEPITGGTPLTLPSPLELKHRILIKSKKTSPYIGTDTAAYSTTSTTTSFSEDGSGSKWGSLRKRTIHTRIHDDLSALGVYLQGLKFRNFSLPELKTYNHCFLLSEKSLNSMLKDASKKTAIDKHNKRYNMRVYPSKIRLKSLNFIPISYWAHGVQMVATNWQTFDIGQQLNEAMFNRKRGYVLKPDDLRRPLLKAGVQPSSVQKQMRFSIDIISAHQLPKLQGTDRAVNPFITFEIFGASDVTWDENSALLRTEVVEENGFNPMWNLRFSGVLSASDDLVFVRFLAKLLLLATTEEEPTTLGVVVARLTDLRRGYRYLPINDLSGEELVYLTIFVCIQYEEIDK